MYDVGVQGCDVRGVGQDRFGLDPARESEWGDLVAEIRRLVDEELSDHQRCVFVALVVNAVPVDVLVVELGTNRNAV